MSGHIDRHYRVDGAIAMRVRLTRFGIIATTALSLALAVAGPAQADTSVDETGTTGFHELRDSEARPGYSCHYKRMNPTRQKLHYEGKLNRIEVQPPKMRAISGRQVVGWRFIVERLDASVLGADWKVRYVSPMQRATTNSSTSASFSMMDVGVRLPANGAHEDKIYEYRVKVRMFWFDTDTDIQGASTHLADWYSWVGHDFSRGRSQTFSEQAPCRGWQTVEIN